jgi:hypothetical protein
LILVKKAGKAGTQRAAGSATFQALPQGAAVKTEDNVLCFSLY